MIGRITSILMKDVADNQRGALRERRRVSYGILDATGPKLATIAARYRLEGLAYFHIAFEPVGSPGNLPLLDSRAISRLRTDLDTFGNVEIAALVNHGYSTADSYLRHYLKDTFLEQPSWAAATQWPMPLNAADGRLRSILAVGHYSFFRALRLGAFLPYAATLAAIGSIVADAALGWPASRRLWTLIRAGLFLWSPWTVGRLWRLWQHLPRPFQAALIGAILVSLLALLGLSIPAHRLVRRNRRAARGVRSVLKRLRLSAGNILWLTGPVPVTLSVLGSIAAWVSYLVNGLPFLKKTR
jgi:hypothetical protein